MRLFGYDIRFQRTHRHHYDGKHGKIEAIDFYSQPRMLYDFSRSEILDCEKMISNRLANVEFNAEADTLTSQDMFCFVMENRLQIIQRLFFDGFLIINTQDPKHMCFVDTAGRNILQSWDGKAYFELCDNEVLQVSETFEATGKSDYFFLKEKLRFYNVVQSADMNLIENYGAMGIVSPDSNNGGGVVGNELRPKDVEQLQEEYKKSYGITLGKWSLMFVPKPVRYLPIQLPISQLKLDEKREYALKSIYAAFGIPKELSVYFESSKYANRNEAELDFYSTTITAWAEVLLQIIKKCYCNIVRRTDYLLPNEFWYDFVDVFALQEAQRVQKEAAREELEFWRNILINFVSDAEMVETANKRIKNLIESL